MDPLLPVVFVAVTPQAEFSLLCERMPPFLTASWLTKCILATKKVEKKEVRTEAVLSILLSTNG